MKKKITRKGYRTLAVIWTLAAASMAVAFVRYLPVEFNLFLLLMTALSMLTAANFWRTCQRTPEEGGPDPFDALPKFVEEGGSDPFDTPPKFADDPVLFDDDPETSADARNKDSEEKNHER